MNKNRLCVWVLFAFLLSTLSFAERNANRAMADGFGSISGQFVLDGDIPKPEPFIRKGDPNVKDSHCCAAQDLFPDDLVIHPKTKGIQHIFVYTKQYIKRISFCLQVSFI